MNMDDTDMESAIPDEDFQEENEFAGIGMRGAVASSGMVDPFSNQAQYRRSMQNGFENDLNGGAVMGQQNFNGVSTSPGAAPSVSIEDLE